MTASVILAVAALVATNASASVEANVLRDSSRGVELVYDVRLAPDLMDWTRDTFAPTIKEWVVRLEDVMASDGWTPPTNILFQFVVKRLSGDTNAMAWATVEKDTVSLRIDWIRENLGGESLGCTIHELVHVMQGYWRTSCKEKNRPLWAYEEYADYIRWFLFEPESDGCVAVRKNPCTHHYNDKYRTTAHFFDFVERKFPGTMKKLNAALRDHSFDDDVFWKAQTGFTPQELETAWHVDTAATAKEVEAKIKSMKEARKSLKNAKNGAK